MSKFQVPNDATKVRNFCILAHVDHGKTSLSDSLIASNGFFSKRLAARIRYLDSREDEQLRGITMMSSAISLVFKMRNQENPNKLDDYLINLIDSPGHIDFSTEVSTASRLSDGALIVVDVVEGVCSQTINVLRQAWIDNLKPLLVLNKIDRLIIELQYTPMDAYNHLVDLINQVNAVLASFYHGEVIEAHSLSTNLETFNPEDDEGIYFLPTADNVVFTSAYDGWGFNIRQFAHISSNKLSSNGIEITAEEIHDKLWGDFYFDPKSKEIKDIPIGKRTSTKKPIFVSFILEFIWKLYTTINEINEDPSLISTLERMLKQSNIPISSKEIKAKQKDPKQLTQLILTQFLPLPNSLLGAVIHILPSPNKAQLERVPALIKNSPHSECLNPKLKKDMINCNPNGYIDGYIAKLVSVPDSVLNMATSNSENHDVDDVMERARRLRAMASQNQASRQTEIKKEIIKQSEQSNEESLEEEKITEEENSFNIRNEESNIKSDSDSDSNSDSDSDIEDPFEYETDEEDATVPESDVESDDSIEDPFEYEIDPDADSDSESLDGNRPESESLLAFTRLYSGTIRTGDEVVLLSPHYDPIKDGNIAYSSSSISLASQKSAIKIQIRGLFVFMGRELVKVEKAVAGMVVGIESDSFGKIILNSGTITDSRLFVDGNGKKEKGSVISLTHEASHLNLPPLLHSTLEPVRLKDLNKLINGVRKLNLADPCVRGYVNENGEVILETAGELHLERCVKDLKERFAGVDLIVGRGRVGFRETIIEDAKTVDVEEIDEDEDENQTDDAAAADDDDDGIIVKRTHHLLLKNYIIKLFIKPLDQREIKNKILATSDKYHNILTCEDSVYEKLLETDEIASIKSGFLLAVKEGPLMAEPIENVEIQIIDVVENLEYTDKAVDENTTSLTQTKNTIHSLFLLASPHIKLATYIATIQTTPDLLGKVYPAISKCKGHIISEEMKEGTPYFTIVASLPVMTSFGFSESVRKDTSGGAIPTLEFKGFELLDEDPFWVPKTEEELEEFGDNIGSAEGRGWAKRILHDVRSSKGMSTNKKIVENAEKQRNMKKD
ncbi:GTPase [Martiniozyma asiatica (nom. inval.)]|nr:GTPase [Martiniozyma asiatica]